MKNNLLKLAGIALSASLIFSQASAGQLNENTSGPLTCNGNLYGGDYIATLNTDSPELTADLFNIAAQQQLVDQIEPLGRTSILITPSFIGQDCHEFMDDIKDTGLVRSIEPNYIQGFGSVSP